MWRCYILLSDEEIRFTVRMVADTANEWDDRLAQMFGGTTHALLSTPEQAQRVPSKPGQGGYL